MMRTRVFISAAAAVLLLAGCGQDPEVKFQELIRAEMPGVSAEMAVNDARAACALMDAGMSMLAATWGMVDAYPNPADAGFVVGAGIETFCPQHREKLGL